MKNKLLRTFGFLIMSITFTIGLTCIPVHASWKCENDTLTIHNETPGKLNNELMNRFGLKYKHIVITGKMNCSDFAPLSCAATYCKSIDISGVKADNIGAGAFCCLDKLEEFICPNNLKTIGRGSFWACHNLKRLVLPKSLESINSSAFQFCNELELVVPENIKLGEKVFLGCPKVDTSKCSLLSEPIKPSGTSFEESLSEDVSCGFKFFSFCRIK